VLVLAGVDVAKPECRVAGLGEHPRHVVGIHVAVVVLEPVMYLIYHWSQLM
jgi:hypothetical protein